MGHSGDSFLLIVALNPKLKNKFNIFIRKCKVVALLDHKGAIVG